MNPNDQARELLQKCLVAVDAYGREDSCRYERDGMMHLELGPQHYRAEDLRAEIDAFLSDTSLDDELVRLRALRDDWHKVMTANGWDCSKTLPERIAELEAENKGEWSRAEDLAARIADLEREAANVTHRQIGEKMSRKRLTGQRKFQVNLPSSLLDRLDIILKNPKHPAPYGFISRAFAKILEDNLDKIEEMLKRGTW